MDSRYPLVEAVKKRVADEEGTVFKSAPLQVALCYPSPYHVGMSSLGFQTIYREVNLHAGAVAERAFLPDDVEAHRKARAPVVTCESLRPISSFALLAFS